MKTPLLLGIAVVGVRLSLAQTCLPPAPGLIGWWPGEDSAADAVGPHDGTLKNGAHFAEGKIGRAFALDGAGGYVDLGAWSAGSTWTLEAWVNPSAILPGRRSILGSAAECLDWSIAIQDGVFGMVIKPPGGCTATLLSPVKAETNTWYHLAGTCDGTNATVYIDGAPAGTAPVQPNYVGTAQGLFIGGEVCCGAFFTGLVDSPAIYNRALSAAEVAAIYAAGAAEKCTNQLPPIVFQLPPAQVYVLPGGSNTLGAAVAGSRPLALQWSFNGANLPGATNATLPLTNFQAINAGNYQLTARNTSGVSTSAVTQVILASVQSFNIQVGDLVTNNVPTAGAGNIETPLGQDNYRFNANAGQTVYFEELSGSPFVWTLKDPNGGVLVSNDPLDGNNVGRRQLPLTGTYQLSVTVSSSQTNATGPYSFKLWNVPAPQEFSIAVGQVVTNGVPGLGAGNIETPGVQDIYDFQTTPGQVLYLRDNGASAPIDWSLLDGTGTYLGADRMDGASPGNFTFVRGGKYQIVVGGANNGPFTGTYSFVLLSPAPIITQQPLSQNPVPGFPATFSVTAQSELPVHYQWLFNGNSLTNQTNATLVLNSVTADEVGTYYVVLTNQTASVVSQAAYLSLKPLVLASSAARTTLPPVPGNGVAIDLFNGIGGGSPPSPDLIQGRTPDGTTLSPVIDFPHPGVVINVGNSFSNFFSDTTTPPDQVQNLSAANFVLRNHFYLRVSRDLDLDPSTPNIDIQLGVGSDDGFALTVGTNLLGNSGDRAFTYTWMPVAFESEGLYPVTLLYDANAVGQSGLEFSWNTAVSQTNQIVPQSVLYVSPNIGDRLITFEEVPTGTVLSNQFGAQGVLFRTVTGQLQVTDRSPDRLVPVSPTHVLADAQTSPAVPGALELQFVAPDTGQPAVTDFVGFFLLNAQGTGATVTAYDTAGAVLYTNTFHAGGASQDPVSIAQPHIARVRIDLGQGPDAAGIDNLSFTTPQAGADLVAGGLVVPPNALPGAAVTITWAVTNVGITTASAPWTEQVLLAGGAGAPPVLLGSFTQSQSLAPGASLVETQEVTVPVSGPAGSLHFQVRVDAFNEVQELDENNNVATASDPTEIPLWLTFDLPNLNTTEGAPALHARLLRNGDLSAPLSVTLTNDNPTELQAPTNLLFAAGASAVAFDLQPLQNGIVSGTQVADLTASAPGFPDQSVALAIADADVPQLELHLTTSSAPEGTTIQGMVHRPAATPDAITVLLSSSDSARVQVPQSVVIETNQDTASFSIVLVDDGVIGPTRNVSLLAQAPGYLDSPPATLAVLDHDVPTLTVTLSKNSVSEGDGPQATVATITRAPVGSLDLALALQSSDPNTLQVPAGTIIPAGQSQVSVPLAAIDDQVVNGTRSVSVTIVPIDAATGATLGAGATAQVTVTDNDGPALQLSLARSLVSKNLKPATTATVTRSGTIGQAATVTLSASDPNMATVPASLTLSAGQTNVTFNIDSLSDGQSGTTKSVSIEASAPGYAPAAQRLVVSDVFLPDLVVTDVSGPAAADTESFVGLTYRLVNQGLAPASTNILTRIFLSKDAVIGDDTLVGDFSFTGTIPPGEFFEQTLQARLPTTPGDYWVVVTVDVDNKVPEILEDNNTTISATPIHVREAYTVTATTDTTVASAGTPIVFHGHAVKTGSNVPAPQVSVHLHLLVRDTRRVLLGVTDDQGDFTSTFQPLPNEAGSYGYAAAHPGIDDPPVQGHFTIIGLRARIPDAPVALIEQVATNLNLSLENLSDQPLSGLKAIVASAPPNLTVTATVPGDGSLAGLGSTLLSVGLLAKDASAGTGTVTLHVKSQEGAQSDVAIPMTIVSLAPRLVVNPSEIVAGMKRGGQAIVEFDVANLGGAATGPLTVLTPDLPWLHLASATPLAPLHPGQTNRISLQLLPTADLPLGEYTGALVLRSGDQSLSVPFRFRALAEAKGDLRITAVDEYTYYADGAPPVTNATVVVRDAVSGTVLTNGVTDAKGQFVVPQLFEGYYDVQVDADKHIGYRGNSLVLAGVTNDVQAFLSRETVQYLWTVVPTQIEDRTTISIETEFETFVPIPVVTIDPAVIDLAQINADVTQIDLHIANHGLIAANDFKLQFSSHPDWQLEPLVSEIGALPANSSLVVPLTIRRLKSPGMMRVQAAPAQASAAPAAGGPCGISGGGSWDIVCGTVKHYGTPIQVLNAGGSCGGGGGGSWGGNGSAGAPFVSGPSFPVQFNCSTNQCKEFDLPDINLGFILKPLAKAAQTAMNAYLDKQLWNFFLGLETEVDPEVKGKIGICCTNNEPKTKFSAELGGEVKLKSGKRNIDLPLTQEIPEFDLGGQTGQLELNMKLFLGTTAVPSFKVSGSYKQDCEHTNTYYEVEVIGGVAIKSGLEGTAKAKFSVNGKAIKEATGLEVKGGVAGGIRFTYKWSSAGENKFCYESDGLYCYGSGPIFGENSDWFTNGKYYLIQPQTNCTEAAGPENLAEMQAALTRLGLIPPTSAATPKVAQLVLPQTPKSAEGGGVCARVRLKLDQDLILTRNAFQASLELINDDPSQPLEDISVQVNPLTSTGDSAADLFQVTTNQLTGISAVDGTGLVNPASTGTATWLLIPTSAAAPDAPTPYQVSGILTYKQGDQHVVIPLSAVPITVEPDPRLEVKYFHQRDVFADDPFTPIIEPSVPYSLAVMVQNSGKGQARNVHITSAQPQIVDNQKGLLIDFKIIGSEVAGQPATPSLTVDFGTIDPGQIAIGRWLMTSTLQGLFESYSATIEHTAGAEDKTTSLIDDLSIHEMIHLVQAPGALDDGKPDFLVNDLPDPESLPDSLYLSDGSTNFVSVVREASVQGQLGSGSSSVQLVASMPKDWAYLQIPDPGQGRYVLRRVVRSDNVEISLGTNVWTTDRTFIGQGRKPIDENVLHLLDYQSTGVYTLFYDALPAPEAIPPVSKVDSLPADSYAQIPVTWSGQDNPGGSGVQSYDIFVSVNGGAFTPWLQNTDLTGSVYDGQLGNSYAFSSVATDRAGNREVNHPTADAQTSVTRVNHAPVLTAIPDQVIKQGDLLLVAPQASDPDGDVLTWSFVGTTPPGAQINPVDGQITWITAEGLGPSTNRFTVQVLDNGIPRLGSLRNFTVTITDQNVAPQIQAVPVQTIAEGQRLIVPVQATDANWPPQHLAFALLSGAPVGAQLDPATGQFTWTPNSDQGGTNYLVSLSVTDDGSPSLSSTQSFTVVVLDTRTDFSLSLGTTNLFAGATNSIPVLLQSSAALTNLAFQIQWSTGLLRDLSLEPSAPEVGSVSFLPISTNAAAVHLLATPEHSLSANLAIARLHFRTESNSSSAVIRIDPSQLLALQADGRELTNGLAQGGRVFLVGPDPVLDIAPQAKGAAQIVLFGLPAHQYQLQTRATLSPGSAWTVLGTFLSANGPVNIPAPLGSGSGSFFRVIELPQGSPRFLLVPGAGPGDWSLYLSGKPAQSYVVETRGLGLGSAWAEERTIVLTNQMLRLDPFVQPDGGRLFRARER